MESNVRLKPPFPRQMKLKAFKQKCLKAFLFFLLFQQAYVITKNCLSLPMSLNFQFSLN